MTEKLSFNDNSDFYHEISCSSKRIVVASVKTYKTTGTYTTLRLFKKDSGQKIKRIQDLSSRGTAKKNKRKQRSGWESDLEERYQYEVGRAKKSRQKITNKASESDKENYLEKWWRQWLSARRNIFVSLSNNIVTLYVEVSLYLITA